MAPDTKETLSRRPEESQEHHDNEAFEAEPEEYVEHPAITRSVCFAGEEANSANHCISPMDEVEMSTKIDIEDGSDKPHARPKIKPKAAVIVRNACKSYGTLEVIKNFSMTIQKESIYSLLGSSGCGKTTILSAIVGIRRLNSGEISVFGAKPGTKESGIPGKRVGYMPQDLALYNVFSIDESMSYFGAIYSMTPDKIASSRNFLVGFLDLPDASRRIGTLSGGQKRRVSLALALIHSPELLILDEPTVGVDPLLRESIWSHLLKLVSSEKTTVIVTTHYIEEARQSDTIGLMRGGRLIQEKSPQDLLKGITNNAKLMTPDHPSIAWNLEHGTELLEDIVLKICRRDVAGNIEDGSSELQEIGYTEDSELDEPYSPSRKSSGPEYKNKRRMSVAILEKVPDPSDFRSTFNRIKALTGKNWVVMTRNLVLLLFILAVPAIQVILICFALGNDPKPMWLGVVNYETNSSDACLNSPPVYEGCDVENLSCKFMSKLPNDTIYLKNFENESMALAQVQAGNLWGFMTFPEGFSDNVYTRASSGNIIDNETLEGSSIHMELDFTNKQITGTLKRLLGDGYKAFTKELLLNCGFHPELAESPIKYLDPIYGSDDTDFREFIAPGIFLGLLFFFPLLTSGVSYIWDKKQGTLERARVAGVNTWEIMMAFFITEAIMMIIQAALSFSIVTLLFKIQVHGSLIQALLLIMLMGFGGVSCGFLISSFCNEEIEAVMIAMAAYFPQMLLAGMLWPIEGMPVVLQYVAYLLPSTLAVESFRNIVSRGWGFCHARVWPGYASTFGWVCFYWISTIYIHKVLLARK